MTFSLELLSIQKTITYMNVLDNLTLVTGFSSNLPKLTPCTPNVFFCLQLKMVSKVVASAIMVYYSVFLGLFHVYVTELKELIFLCASKPNKTQTRVCSKESKDLFRKLAPNLKTQVS